MFLPQVADRPLTLGTFKPPAHHPRSRQNVALLGDSLRDPVTDISRNAMLALIYLSHQAQWNMPEISDFPDPALLSHFVDLYFDHFHPTFPILHKPTFYSTSIPAP